MGFRGSRVQIPPSRFCPCKCGGKSFRRAFANAARCPPRRATAPDPAGYTAPDGSSIRPPHEKSPRHPSRRYDEALGGRGSPFLLQETTVGGTGVSRTIAHHRQGRNKCATIISVKHH